VLHFLGHSKAQMFEVYIGWFSRNYDTTHFLADFKTKVAKYFNGRFTSCWWYTRRDEIYVGKRYVVTVIGLTITGKTVAENLGNVPKFKKKVRNIKLCMLPIKASGHLEILYGNLQEEGAVATDYRKRSCILVVPAKVFDDEFLAQCRYRKRIVKKGDVWW